MMQQRNHVNEGQQHVLGTAQADGSGLLGQHQAQQMQPLPPSNSNLMNPGLQQPQYGTAQQNMDMKPQQSFQNQLMNNNSLSGIRSTPEHHCNPTPGVGASVNQQS